MTPLFPMNLNPEALFKKDGFRVFLLDFQLDSFITDVIDMEMKEEMDDDPYKIII